jgi:hypothetical protein
MKLIQNDNLNEANEPARGEPEAGCSGKLPLAVALGLGELKTYTVAGQADAERFTGKKDLPNQWAALPEDDLEPVMPRLLAGLQYAIKYFCNALPGVYFESFGLEAMLDKELKVLLYRCVCELVGNARQAGAGCVFVQLSLGEETISVTVNDNGCGFHPDTAVVKSGLGNICAFVLARNGQLNIFTAEGEGTEITIEIEQPNKTELYDKTSHRRPSYHAD